MTEDLDQLDRLCAELMGFCSPQPLARRGVMNELIDPWDMKLLFEHWLYEVPEIKDHAYRSGYRALLLDAFRAGYGTACMSKSEQKMIINGEKKIRRDALREAMSDSE